MKIKVYFFALLMLITLPLGACTQEPTTSHTLTFPADLSGKTELNAPIYDIEPFTVHVSLPKDWTVAPETGAEDFPFLTVYSRYTILDKNETRIGTIGYHTYQPLDDAADDPRAIYSQIALGNNYHFDVRDSYTVISETNRSVTAVADVYYSASINGGEEKRNTGLLAFDKTLFVYIAGEFDSEHITQKQVVDIAKSLSIA